MAIGALEPEPNILLPSFGIISPLVRCFPSKEYFLLGNPREPGVFIFLAYQFSKMQRFNQKNRLKNMEHILKFYSGSNV